MLECKNCKKCFDYKSDYIKHMSMRGYCGTWKFERRFVCDLCDKPFVNKSSLTRHNKNIHNFKKNENKINV